MSRLLMNMIQYEAGLVPSTVKRESRAAYIQSLVDAAEVGDSTRFVKFMLEHHKENVEEQIADYKRTTEECGLPQHAELPRNFLEISQNLPASCPAHTVKTYLAIVRDPSATNKQLGDLLGVSDRTIRAHVKDLKDAGLIVRVGSDRSGYWEARQ